MAPEETDVSVSELQDRPEERKEPLELDAVREETDELLELRLDAEGSEKDEALELQLDAEGSEKDEALELRLDAEASDADADETELLEDGERLSCPFR